MNMISTTVPLLRALQSSHQISRREFVDMIASSSIQHEGKVVTSIDYEIDLGEKIEIRLESWETALVEIIKPHKHRPVIVLFNKPAGYVVSKDDPHNKTIFEILPESRRRDFFPIGRLDKDSTWLLLLTNQPDLVDEYLHPRRRMLKIYEVKIDKVMPWSDCLRAKKGLLVDHDGTAWIKQTDGSRAPRVSKTKHTDKKQPKRDQSKYYEHKDGYGYDIQSIKGKKTQTQTPEWLETLSCADITMVSTAKGHYVRIALEEGKNRHIRRLLKALWYRVSELKRISFGPYKLGTIRPWRTMIQELHTPKKSNKKKA